MQPVETNTELLPVHILSNVKENKTSKREKKKKQIFSYVVDVIKACVQFVLDSKLIRKVGIPTKVYSYVRKVVINNFFFRDQ